MTYVRKKTIHIRDTMLDALLLLVKIPSLSGAWGSVVVK